MGKRKGRTNRSAARWAGRVNQATVQYHEHARSLERGETVPATREDLVAHMTRNWTGIEPTLVMPEKGVQVPEPRDQAPPVCRVQERQMELEMEHNLPAVEVFIRVWKGVRRQGLDVFHSQDIYHPVWRHMKLWFSGNSFFFQQLKTQDPKCLRVSIEYIGRDRADRALARGIDWKKNQYRSV